MLKRIIYIILLLFLIFNYKAKTQSFKLGVDIFISEEYKMYKGKNLGLITNATGVTSERKSTIDALIEKKDPLLIKLFAPEHGIRGDIYAGESVTDYIDSKTGLPVFSLYGKRKIPGKDILKDIEVLIYDIQDIGNRTYTYISTMVNGMQAAAENNIEFIIFDRPIPLYGNLIDGNILEPEFKSFIGIYPIPYVYGMTSGELAKLFNTEFNINAKLTVIKMQGYCHDMDFNDTGLMWIPTSPHIPRAESAYYCAITGCMGELGSVCEGVGYTLPFELIGEEWIIGDELAQELNARELPGVYFFPTFFKPFYGGFKDKKCSGVQIFITDYKKVLPFTTQLHILEAIQKLYPESNYLNGRNKNRIDSFNKAAGTDKIRNALLSGKNATEIIKDYQQELERFKEIRKKYLLYE